MTASKPLDLRDLIEAGIDPLSAIIDQSARVERGGTMEMLASSDPLTLRICLARAGFSSTVEKVVEGKFRVCLKHDGLGVVDAESCDKSCSGYKNLGAPLRQTADGQLEIDLRGLAPPGPMSAILQLLSMLPHDNVVSVIFDYLPIFLIPELAELGWTLLRQSRKDGLTRFTLSKNR